MTKRMGIHSVSSVDLCVPASPSSLMKCHSLHPSQMVRCCYKCYCLNYHVSSLPIIHFDLLILFAHILLPFFRIVYDGDEIVVGSNNNNNNVEEFIAGKFAVSETAAGNTTASTGLRSSRRSQKKNDDDDDDDNEAFFDKHKESGLSRTAVDNNNNKKRKTKKKMKTVIKKRKAVYVDDNGPKLPSLNSGNNNDNNDEMKRPYIQPRSNSFGVIYGNQDDGDEDPNFFVTESASMPAQSVADNTIDTDGTYYNHISSFTRL